ncbi:MAG: Endoglucanase, partial [Myxococcaceae bacterium]|nr:Endoglucanase [Myxococcaceae bacterium]
MPAAAPDLAVLAAASRRVRWQRALRAAASLAVVALALAVALLLLARLGVVHTRHPYALALAPLALPLLGALAGALRRVRPLDAARRLDAHHHLHDRLGIAWQFRQKPDAERTPFMRAAIDDAAARARDVDVRAALPWRLPPELRVVAVLAALLVLVARVPIPARTSPRAARLPATVNHRDVADLHDDDLAAFREAARQLEATARTDEARRGVEGFNRLLDDLAHRRLDREEAFRRLAALQETAAAQDAAADRRVAEALRTMGDEM